MVFHWSPSDSKSPLFSGTHISSLTNLNNALVWRVSIFPPISNSSSFFSKSLGTVLNVPIPIGTIITLMINSIYIFWYGPNTRLVLVLVFSLSFSLIFALFSAGTAKFTIQLFLFFFFFLLIITWSRLLAVIKKSFSISKSQRCFARLILQDGFRFVHIPFITELEFQVFALFPLDHRSHPVESCLILRLR